MKKLLLPFVIGLIIGLLILPICGYLYVRLGFMPVATEGPSLPLEKWVAHTSLNATISKQAPHEAKFPPSDENLIAGATIYRDTCAVCHGMKDQPKTPTAKGMYPPPPQLLSGKGVTDDPVGETYWKVTHGIRLTGMPAYGGSLSDLQLWQVSQMLAHATNLPAAAVQALSTEPPAK